MINTVTAGTVRFDAQRVEDIQASTPYDRGSMGRVVAQMTESDMLNMQTREINLREELRVSKTETTMAQAAEAQVTIELSLRQADIAVLQSKNADLEAQVALGQVVPAPVPVDPPVVLQ